MKKTMRFSIITPVYNRENYIKRCVDSVLAQSFPEWELLLIDDGSSDTSYEKCLAFQARDKRIQCFHQDNAGAGAARNQGIELAQGEYILFLDSDDWYEPDCLEEIAKATDACKPDIVTFFLQEWTGTSNPLVTKRQLVNLDQSGQSISSKLLERDQCVGTRAYNRDFWKRHNIKFSHNRFHEDVIVGFLCYAYADSVIQLNRVFYNYDLTTPNSSQTYCKEDEHELLLAAFEEMIQTFTARDLIKKYHRPLALAALIDLRGRIFARGRKQSESFITNVLPLYYQKIEMIDNGVFRQTSRKYIVFGSYTLRSAVNTLVLEQNHVVHFQFSSLSAAMRRSSLGGDIKFSHGNPFRQSMVNAELGGEFQRRLRGDDYDYLVVDLMEERFGLLDFGDFIATDSDAFQEGSISCGMDKAAAIPSGSAKAKQLFRDVLKKLREALGESYDMKRLVLVENYLMEDYGDFGKEKKFDNLDEIRKMNEILGTYYRMFCDAFPCCRVVTPDQSSSVCFSDTGYKHGCHPWHSVEAWECDLAEAISAVLEER